MNHLTPLAALMTPEILTAALGGIALILSAIGGLLAVIIPLVQRINKDVKDIKVATNGAKTHQEAVRVALEDKVDGLEQRLADAFADKVAAALLTRQAADAARMAASDVRAERAAPAPTAADQEGR